MHTGNVEGLEIQEKTFSIEEKKVLLSIVEENRCLWDSASPDFLNKKIQHSSRITRDKSRLYKKGIPRSQRIFYIPITSQALFRP